MPSSMKDIVSGGVLFALSIVMFIASFSIRRVLPIGVSSGFFPKIVAVLLAFVSVLIVIQGFRARAREKGTAGEQAGCGAGQVVLATLFLLGFYVALLQTLGFVITTFVYLVGQFAVLAPKDQRKWIPFIAIAAVVSVGTYYIFYNLFHLILPTGIFG